MDDLIAGKLDKFHHLGTTFLEEPMERRGIAVSYLIIAKLHICIYIYRRFLNY
jgi:hypothetical protein